MSIRISHQGMFNNGGTPFALAAGLVVAVGQQAAFAHYGKLAARTTTQGEIQLAGPTTIASGVFVDVSPKGDTCTVETEGYEWVPCDLTGVTVGGLVTVAAGGTLVKIAGATPTAAELLAGVWEVDTIDATAGKTKVLICVCCRL
jgi:hypothetical protein